MKNTVFVAPFLLPATLRFVKSVARLPGIRLGLITHDRLDRLPEEVKQRVHSHFRVGNCLDPGQLAVAAKGLANRMGGIDRLFGSLEELQIPIARVRDLLHIEGMGGTAAVNFRDKSQMKDVLRRNGVPCARHCLVTRQVDAWDFVNQVGYPVVVKPPDGAGARNTFQVDSDQKLKDYLAGFSPSKDNPALLEEFIKGDEYSFEGISIGGRVVWNSLTRYYPNPLEVLKNPWIQWCILLPREVDDPFFEPIRQANRSALTALGMKTGLSHMEWFRRGDGTVAISEVGARPPGAQIMTLMSYATDKNFYNAWAELMVFERFDPPPRKFAAGAAFLRGVGHGRVKAVRGLNQAQKEVGSVVVEAKLPQLGQSSTSGYEGVGYVIVRHPETEVVKKVLRRLVSLIRVEYA